MLKTLVIALSLLMVSPVMGADPQFDVQKHIDGMGATTFVERERHYITLFKEFTRVEDSYREAELRILWHATLDGYNRTTDLEIKQRCRRLLGIFQKKIDLKGCSIWSLPSEKRFLKDGDLSSSYYMKAWHNQASIWQGVSYSNVQVAEAAFILYVEDLSENKKYDEIKLAIKTSRLFTKSMHNSASYGAANWEPKQAVALASWFNTNFPPPSAKTLIRFKRRGVTIMNHVTPINLTRVEMDARDARLVPEAPDDDAPIAQGQPPFPPAPPIPAPPAPPAPEPEEEKEDEEG